MKTTVGRLAVFRRFEESARVAIEVIPPDTKEQLAQVLAYLSANVISCKLHELREVLQPLFRGWETTPVVQMADILRVRMAQSVANMSALVSCLVAGRVHAKEGEIFLRFFGLFLDVFGVILSVNMNCDVEELIRYGKTSFPRQDTMNRAIAVHNGIENMKRVIKGIQARSLGNAASCIEMAEGTSAAAEDVSACFTQHECRIALIMNAMKQLEGTRTALKFLLLYDGFLKEFGPDPHPTVRFRSSPTVSAAVVEHFVRFSGCLLSFTKAGLFTDRVCPDFIRNWLAFVRSVVLTEEMDRKTVFRDLVDSVPFIGLAGQMRKAFFDMKVIESRLYVYAAKHEEEDCSVLFEVFFCVQRSFVSMMTTGQLTSDVFATQSEAFLAAVMRQSLQLHGEIQKLWPTVVRLFGHMSTLVTFESMKRHLIMDLELDLQKHSLFRCLFISFAFATVKAMARAYSSDYVPHEMPQLTDAYRRTVVRCMTSTGHIHARQANTTFASMAAGAEALKQLWNVRLLNGLSKRARPYLKTLIVLVGHSRSGWAAHGRRRLLEVDALLDMFDSDSSRLDKFTILSEILAILSTVGGLETATQKEAAAGFKKVIDFGCTVLVVMTHLTVMDVYTSEFAPVSQPGFMVIRTAVEVAQGSSVATSVPELPSLVDRFVKHVSRIKCSGSRRGHRRDAAAQHAPSPAPDGRGRRAPAAPVRARPRQRSGPKRRLTTGLSRRTRARRRSRRHRSKLRLNSGARDC